MTMVFRHAISRRDAILILFGASIVHVLSFFVSPFGKTETTEIDASSNKESYIYQTAQRTITETLTITRTTTIAQTITTSQPLPTSAQFTFPLAETEIVHHAPGWTLFHNLYMSNGTFFILMPEDSRHGLPQLRMMISNPLPADTSPENIALREPSEHHMSFISPKDAARRWETRKSLTTIEGSTLFVNDPSQFLRHYYHLVAELFFGVQAFWHGVGSQPVTIPPATSLYPTFNMASVEEIHIKHPAVKPLDRVIFARTNADGWRDDPGFNAYFIRAAFPSMTVEHQEDWEDRVHVTEPWTNDVDRAYHFPAILITDRSAAHRGDVCGSKTQRTAAEAWELMRGLGKLRGAKAGGWWEPVRSKMLEFAGVKGAEVLDQFSKQSAFTEDRPATGKDLLPLPDKIVITYTSRQSAGHRKLTPDAHTNLIASLKELVDRKNSARKESDLEWELLVIEAQQMTKDEQLAVAGKTTFLVGVHGNGLTHLVWMPPTRYSSVIEIFYPTGFAHDYQWTTKALGMTHYAVWDDKYHTSPEEPPVNYPEPGFQGDAIPVHGPTVVKIIEDRVGLR